MAQLVLIGAYSLHMAATAVWIGGLAFLTLFLPRLSGRLSESDRNLLASRAARTFRPYAWICLTVFAVTGLTQMSASPRYEGLLAVSSPWAAAILVKHLLILGMAGILVYQTWALHPRLERLQLEGDRSSEPLLAVTLRSERRLQWFSLGLAGLVLVLTALARVSA